MQATTTRPKVTATADRGRCGVSCGSRLLADVADRTTLTAQLAEELAGLRKHRARHDPVRVLVDMAVAFPTARPRGRSRRDTRKKVAHVFAAEIRDADQLLNAWTAELAAAVAEHGSSLTALDGFGQ